MKERETKDGEREREWRERMKRGWREEKLKKKERKVVSVI
jgi:hypothetical protein